MPDTTPSQARELAERLIEGDVDRYGNSHVRRFSDSDRERLATALRSLADQVERVTKVRTADVMVGYAMHYGSGCRDCADGTGICDTTGMPCGGREKATRYVCRALEYGFQHGFVDPQYAVADPNTAALAAVTKERDALREALTPSGATKCAYIGEIKDSFVQYDEFGDEQYCTRPVSWDATKATMAMILARAALKETDQ